MRKFLQPLFNVGLTDCLQLHESRATPPALIYDITLQECYTAVPNLPSDFDCSTDDELIVLLYCNESQATGSPNKLTMAGMYTRQEAIHHDL